MDFLYTSLSLNFEQIRAEITPQPDSGYCLVELVEEPEEKQNITLCLDSDELEEFAQILLFASGIMKRAGMRD